MTVRFFSPINKDKVCAAGMATSEIANTSFEARDGRKSACVHYSRRCDIECPDCLKFFPCRLCHNLELNHELNRHAVKRVKCSVCHLEQKISPTCEECKTIFGKYYCLICSLFDDCDKGQYHCDGCGLCRVGGRDNFFHCDKCNLCLSNGIKTSHKCIENSSKSNCPICLEDMHTSTQGLQVPACGHLIHGKCYKAMLRHGDYRCAICGKSTVEMSNVWKKLDDEIASTPMPEEYADTTTCILCKDCQAVSQVKFHVLGMKCGECNSYNTCSTSSPTERKSIAREVQD